MLGISVRDLLVAATIPLVGIAPLVAFGQALASASLTGEVTDSAGNSIPGAKVTVTGLALQVPQVNSVTDDEGNYTIVDLPAPGCAWAATSASRLRLDRGQKVFRCFTERGFQE
jgi:hypothetical protein